jgi:hypothetical protein
VCPAQAGVRTEDGTRADVPTLGAVQLPRRVQHRICRHRPDTCALGHCWALRRLRSAATSSAGTTRPARRSLLPLGAGGLPGPLPILDGRIGGPGHPDGRGPLAPATSSTAFSDSPSAWRFRQPSCQSRRLFDLVSQRELVPVRASSAASGSWTFLSRCARSPP